jgi:hypothetical protein
MQPVLAGVAMTPAPQRTRARLRLVGIDEPAGGDRTLDYAGSLRDRANAVASENRRASFTGGAGEINHSVIDARDPRWVLAMQTQARLQGATLTPERRDELLKSGRRLGLRPFEANLVIAVVQDRARASAPLRLAQPTLSIIGSDQTTGDAPSTPSRSRALIRWFLVGGAAALVANAVIRWLAAGG